MNKLLMIAAMTAAVATAAHAAVIDDQRRLDDLNAACRAAGGPTSETDQACAAADKLISDLGHRGYCVYGHGVIGIKGKGNHCYEIKVISRGDYLKKWKSR